MVLWCKVCGALMGIREPATDWSVDRTGICLQCAATQFDEKDLEDSGVIVPPKDSSDG